MTAPPTVAHLKAAGCKGMRAMCGDCKHMADATWGAVQAEDAELFPRIKNRLKCGKCGSKRISIMPDWPPAGPGGLPKQGK